MHFNWYTITVKIWIVGVGGKKNKLRQTSSSLKFDILPKALGITQIHQSSFQNNKLSCRSQKFSHYANVIKSIRLLHFYFSTKNPFKLVVIFSVVLTEKCFPRITNHRIFHFPARQKKYDWNRENNIVWDSIDA